MTCKSVEGDTESWGFGGTASSDAGWGWDLAGSVVLLGSVNGAQLLAGASPAPASWLLVNAVYCSSSQGALLSTTAWWTIACLEGPEVRVQAPASQPMKTEGKKRQSQEPQPLRLELNVNCFRKRHYHLLHTLKH